MQIIFKFCYLEVILCIFKHKNNYSSSNISLIKIENTAFSVKVVIDSGHFCAIISTLNLDTQREKIIVPSVLTRKSLETPSTTFFSAHKLKTTN